MNLIDRIARAVEARLMAALDEMETDGPAFDAAYDAALADAKARGLDYDAAHAEAARIADEWKAQQQAGKE